MDSRAPGPRKGEGEGEGDRACSRAIRVYASGRLSSAALVTHRFPLKEFSAAYDVYHNSRDGSVKVVVEM